MSRKELRRNQAHLRSQEQAKTWQYSQCQCRIHNDRGINPGKLCDEIFRPGLLLGGLLHQLQNLGNGGILKGLQGLYTKHALSIDTAGNNLFSGEYLSGDGLSGKGCRIYHAFSLTDNAVHRHSFSRLYQKHIPYFYLIRIHGIYGAVFSFNVGQLRYNIHQLLNGLSAFSYRIALEKLSHLIEDHYRHRFRKFSGKEGA